MLKEVILRQDKIIPLVIKDWILQILFVMSTQDNNLLTFLKKQTLFGNSPTKIKRKSSSRSKDKNSSSRGTPTKQQIALDPPRTNLFAPQPEPKFSFSQYQPPAANYNPSYGSSNPQSYGNPNPTSYGNSNPKFSQPLVDSRSLGFDEPVRGENHKQNDIFLGLVSYSTQFESARIESAQCLENLSSDIRNQITNINFKIENFNNRMYKVIVDEFKSLRDRINHIIDESFKESEKYIREYMKGQQQKLAGEMIKYKEVLQKEYMKVQNMKEEIKGDNWRRTAGEIIATEMESKIKLVVKESSQINVGKWDLGDIIGYRLKDLEKDLREIVKLRKQK